MRNEMGTRKTWTVGLTTAFVVLGTAGAATAVATTSDGGGSSAATHATAAAFSTAGKKGTRDGSKRLCKRAPRIEKRLNRTLRKMSDKGRGRGSDHRLEKRIDHAKKAGHDAVATYLNDKLDTRAALAPKLKKREKDLQKVRSWCSAHRNGRS